MAVGSAKITQKEIGRRLNLSVMTVSKALRGHPDISEGTRQQVLDEARRHHYVPNLLAKSLTRSRTKVIGFLFPDITFDFAHSIVCGAKSVLGGEDYLTIIGLTSWNVDEESREVDMMLGRQVDGIICQPVNRKSEETYRRVVECGIPLVFVGNGLKIPDANWVALDGYDAARCMMTHLFEQGHRRIAFVSPDVLNEDASLASRFEGYKDALTSQGLTIVPECIGLGRVGEASSIAEVTDRLMAWPDRPTAILTAVDAVGYQVMDRLIERGHRVPHDVAVAAMGGLSFSAYRMISLSTIDEGTSHIGELAARVMLDRLNDRPVSAEMLVKGSLVVRHSTCTQA